MKGLIVSVLLVLTVIVRPATAQQGGQDVVWIQIEAHPSLRVAQDRARVYAGRLADVAGFSLGGTWYGIVLGPYTRADAERVLQIYKAERQIPQDSFIAFTRNFGQQFWPIGANVLDTGAIDAPIAAPDPAPEPAAPAAAQTEAQDAQPAVPALPEIKPSDETPAEARRSERLLSGEERKELQIALQAAGFYNSAIDGAFGRGTRNSMSAWQEANGYEPTGILTTMQRKALMDQYNAPLLSVGMRLVTDSKAGIQIELPMGEVAFSRYEYPFAQYDSSGALGARVLLISQRGDRATLFGLYDIMQTLAIVPLEGPRKRGDRRFTLEGRNDKIVSFTQAQLQDGQIKGFTLVWPAGDEARRSRVLAEMQKSFTPIDGVLSASDGGDAPQSIDLVSGLEIRKPKLSRSGFFIDARGTLVTTLDAVQSCSRITVDEDHPAEVLATDDALGVAVLRPAETLAPVAVAQLSDDIPRLRSDIAVAGFSYEGALGAPTLTFGTLADTKGLHGEEEMQRLALSALSGDAGGPVIDVSGGVIGMLLPPPSGERKLPDNVSLAADATALRGVLGRAGVMAAQSTARGAVSPDELNRLATGMTVLVSCWD